MKDLIRGSFVPSGIVQRMRQYNRRIFDLNKEIIYKLTKLDSVLQRCNIRISNYVSSIDSKSYNKIVRLLSEGITDAVHLASFIHGRMVNRVGKDTIIVALTGVISETDIDLVRQYLQEITLSQEHKQECQEKLSQLCKNEFPKEFENLQTIPGVKERSATAILAEIGADMKMFITASFSKFSYTQTVIRKKNTLKVKVAIARKMLIAIWHVLSESKVYTDYKKPATASTHNIPLIVKTVSLW